MSREDVFKTVTHRWNYLESLWKSRPSPHKRCFILPYDYCHIIIQKWLISVSLILTDVGDLSSNPSDLPNTFMWWRICRGKLHWNSKAARQFFQVSPSQWSQLLPAGGPGWCIERYSMCTLHQQAVVNDSVPLLLTKPLWTAVAKRKGSCQCLSLVTIQCENDVQLW